ncbi:MAG TPA: VWA domain-containing protein, partial [Thermoanaerobaculia bacterium]|nr:VWA domain-containing protein [Thermoanaerobaculia bacterium]
MSNLFRDTLIRTSAAILLVLLAVPSGQLVAQTEKPPSEPAIARPDPTADPGVRKLSRREQKDRIANLDQKYRDFLRDVEPIMLPTELNSFLLMESDAQRDVYIEDFWNRRDPDPRTAYNEFREKYAENLELARSEFKNMVSDRSRILLTRGHPDNRIKANCDLLVPLEIWYYANLAEFGRNTRILFYQPRNGGDFRLWQPRGLGSEDLADLISQDEMSRHQFNNADAVRAVFQSDAGRSAQGTGLTRGRGMSPIEFRCPKDGEEILNAVYGTQMNRMQIHQLFNPPEVNTEDVNRILRTSVLTNPDAPVLEAELTAAYPGKRGARTSVELTLLVGSSELTPIDVDGAHFYNIDVTGEVLKDDKLFESYRYRYNFPADGASAQLPITIERFLRPADYKSRIKITDVNSGAEGIVETDLVVPQIQDSAERTALKAEGTRTIRALQEDVERSDTRLRIVPLSTDLLTGLQHIETILTGDVQAVEFYLDGKRVMIKRTPPYSLDLDLGRVPQPRTIKAVGLDADGEIITGDEIIVNQGADPFRVRIVSPRIAPKISGRVRVELDAQVPDGKQIESLDLFLNETKLASLFEPPWVQTINVPEDLGIAYIRAVATMKDSDVPAAEDVVFINSPEFLQEVDVHLVELPTTVLSGNRLVNDLQQEAFKVFDQGQPVKIAKFDHVDNMPLSLGIAVDSSGSMRPKMLEAQKAGAQFFKSILKPGDKAFVTAFDREPVLVQKWTPNLADLSAGLGSLRAEDNTALYDAIVYSLYNFQGIKGQKALIVISDGRDTASRFSLDQALEYSRRTAVPIYGIGIGIR